MIIQKHKTPMLAFKPKKDVWPIPALMRSSVCVRGDRNASIKPAWGIESRGMNSPLTNIKGILKKFRGIITSPGRPVGMEANSIPIAENAIADSPIPRMRAIGSETDCPIQYNPTPAASVVT